MNFVKKSLLGHLSISPWSGARGLERFIWLKYYIYWNGKKYTPFRAQRCRKYATQPKNLQVKVVRHWILSKKVCRGICLSPPEWSLGARKIYMVEILHLYKTENPFHLGLPKIRSQPKNLHSYNCGYWTYFDQTWNTEWGKYGEGSRLYYIELLPHTSLLCFVFF